MIRAVFSHIQHFVSHRKLRFDIVSSFLLLFLTSSIFILSYAYQGSKKSSVYFATQILSQMSATTAEKTRKYIHDAQSAVNFAEGFFDTADIDFLEDANLQDSFFRILRLYPYFTVIQVALADGDYMSIERAHPDTKYVTDTEKSLPDNVRYLSQYQIRSQKGTQKEVWTYFDESETLVSKEQNEFLVYDARKRPWYLNTEQKRRFNWSPIYTFSFSNVPSKIPGTTASIPLFDKAVEREKEVLLGVIGIDLSLEELSQFLQKNKASENGTSFILNEEEQLVASSNRNHLSTQGLMSESIITIDAIEDDYVKAAFNLYKKNQENSFEFTFDGRDYLASFEKLDDQGGSFWMVGLVVPVDDFLVNAKMIRDHIFWVILVALALSTFFIVLLSRRISQPIMEVARETQRIQNLEMSENFHIKSGILEIQVMLESLAAMRNSLQSFGKFVPKRLVKRLIQKGGEVKLGGRKKEVTIFFSDIVDFSSTAENLGAEKLVGYLSTYLDELSSIINDTQGTIDKYIGDAIMAFWGAPLNDAKQTFHACHAALLCQQTLRHQNRAWELENKPTFPTRIGMHRDEVLVGIIGSEEKMNYTAMGDGVNIAARLEGMNKMYDTSILVSESIVENVGEAFLFRPLDFIAVKGRKKSLKIFELVAQNKGDATLLPSEEQKQLVKTFERAFKLYTLQKWSEALNAFEAVRLEFPHDYPAQLMRDRCKEFKRKPPPSDWDGVTIYTKK